MVQIVRRTANAPNLPGGSDALDSLSALSGADSPIGVFDSGVGGLSVLKEIRAELPREDLLYVADSGHAPYGERSEQFIVERARAIVGFLCGRGAKAIVVACNTATAVAIQTLRAQLDIPVVAMEPAIKPAVRLTKTGVIGVLATSRTLASPSFARLTGTYGDGVQVILQACPGFVEQVEKGELESATTRQLVTRYVEPLVEQGVDTLVLGCTHYPFLRPVIESVAGAAVTVVDPSAAVARQVRRRLENDGLLMTDSAGRRREYRRREEHRPGGDGRRVGEGGRDGEADRDDKAGVHGQDRKDGPYEELRGDAKRGGHSGDGCDTTEQGSTFFWTSGVLAQVEVVISTLWGDDVEVRALPGDDD